MNRDLTTIRASRSLTRAAIDYASHLNEYSSGTCHEFDLALAETALELAAIRFAKDQARVEKSARRKRP